MTEQTTADRTGNDASAGPSGADLARLALQQARLAAKNNGARTPHRRRTTTTRRDGREPSGFAAVLQNLMADRAWDVPAAGGNVLDQWPDIAAALSPKLAVHVQAVAFHAETGQLDLRPDSPAYATHLRLISSRIVAAANDAVGTQVVRTVRVLRVGTTAPVLRRPGVVSKSAAAPEVAVKTRQEASPGFHRALAAHQAVTPAQRLDPGIAEAVERQTRAMRELSRRAFPEMEAAVEDAPAPINAAHLQRRREAAAIEAAALRRARAERAARQAGTAALVPAAPLPLRTTA
ncbi:DciA family protein [Streptomyces sp. NPDC056347]|uniref:DciA family protein n=1 Tax=Streptomyces sp. NPDC056347 TaxID=3345790 RepID=UPI0035E2D55A